MWRGLFGILAGVVAWMAGFFILAFLAATVWHDYALHGRAYFRQGVFTFTPLMAVLNAALWVVAEIAAGWVSTRVAKRREAAWVLAVLLQLYYAAMHLVFYWSRFPWWYNVTVVACVIPSVLLGARLAATRSRPAPIGRP